MITYNHNYYNKNYTGDGPLTAEIIVVTSGKGGVGKTTTSASLATGLAMAGKKTAVIDFDVGLRSLDADPLGLRTTHSSCNRLRHRRCAVKPRSNSR